MKSFILLTAQLLASSEADLHPSFEEKFAQTRAAEQPNIDKAIEVLGDAAQLKIFALDSWEEPVGGCREDSLDGSCFMGWRVAGSASIDDPQVIAEIRQELMRWLQAPEPEGIPLCFFPHHGVRISSDESRFDFAICYSCDSMQILRHEPAGQASVYLESDRSLLDQILIQNGIQPTGLDYADD